MSIFQIKELWSTNVGNNEEFDKNSICIGNVDNTDSRENKIVVGRNFKKMSYCSFIGSFEGMLRIYLPKA